MKLTAESKFFIGMIVVIVGMLSGTVLLFSQPKKSSSNNLIIPTTHIQGARSPKASLVEFSNFECPACAAYVPIIQELIQNHPNTLLFAHRHFPFPNEPLSLKAAVAAEAAGRQGKFWDMWQMLFEKQSSLSEKTIADVAQSLNLNMDTFASDSASIELQNIVKADQSFAFDLGLTATPTFFLNGVKLELQGPNDLKSKVEKAIQK